ncbi:MAG: response regulator [Chloroflexota bacterium]
MSSFDVVFIDDEPSITEIFQHYVLWKYKNWRFVTFNNPVLAYNEIIGNQLSATVWIIDMMMPGKNGAEIASAIRSKSGESPVLLAYTALDRQALQTQEQYRSGLKHFNRVINKKEDLSDVLSLVDVWVKQ